METLASFWSHVPCDLGQSRHEASSLWETRYVESSAPSVSCAMWTELSPHLQRNKQLHDTLLQREEELARLQEENQKLRQFLNSSFVKDLEEKAKKLCFDGKRKRNLSSFTPPISKRLCRNLTAEFCSESEPSETSLDLWVLKMLGLKDKDTIDTEPEHNNTTTDQYLSPIEDNTTSENQNTNDIGFENVSTDFPTTKNYNSTRYSSNGQSPNRSLTTEKAQPEVSQWSSHFQTTISYSPTERLNFSAIPCSTPKESDQNAGNVPSPIRFPNSGPDLAFSMSLSPNYSLKTHSFAHGQAFVRRDAQGRCSFTWVPRDRP